MCIKILTSERYNNNNTNNNTDNNVRFISRQFSAKIADARRDLISF